MTTKIEIKLLASLTNPETAKGLILRRDKIAAVTGVHISILEFDLLTKKMKIRVEQKKLINNWILSQKELDARAKELFKEVIPSEFDIHYIVLTYNPDLDIIDIPWIKAQMTKFNITKPDIIKHLNIDKSTLSLFFSGERSLTKSQKSAFLYYFMVFEINRDIRAKG